MCLLSQDGWTALMHASGRGCLECVEALLQKGANPNIPYNVSNVTLCIADVCPCGVSDQGENKSYAGV